MERIFEHKDVPNDKKVKLVALKPRKYASICGQMQCLRELRREKERLQPGDR